MNELGILVDLSHCGRQTAADAIKASTRPVAFTHTGSAAQNDHPRNRTDAELRAVAEKGGVSGVFFMPFLSEGRQPTAADVIRHLEHMIQVAGEEHVSIGTDGGISPEVVTPEFRERHAGFVRRRREAGISAPGETEDGFLFANELNTARRLETLAGMLSVARPLRRAHREDPRRQPRPRLHRHLEGMKHRGTDGQRGAVWRRAAFLALLCIALAALATSTDLHRALLEVLEASREVIVTRPVSGALLFVLLAAISAMFAFVSIAVVIPLAVYVWGNALSLLLLWIGLDPGWRGRLRHREVPGPAGRTLADRPHARPHRAFHRAGRCHSASSCCFSWACRPRSRATCSGS